MNVLYWISVILVVTVCPPCFVLTVYWLRRAAKFNKITRKIHAREPLTDREQRMLDKARS